MMQQYKYIYIYIYNYICTACYSINSLVYFFNISADGYILNVLK
jgi:hypothetical protein